jgi:hypothetical protein
MDSQKKGIVINDDTSVDIYFGPKPPQGKESNWVQTVPARAGTPSCASTALSSPGSTRPGGRARSRKCVAAEVEVPEKGEGVLATIGGRFGGWALTLMDGVPRFDYAISNPPKYRFRIAAKDKLAAGKHTIRFDFKYDGGGIGKGADGTLSIDGKEVATGRFERTVDLRFSLDETFDVGEDTGTPVAEDYADKMPFKFTGKLSKLVIELKK